MPRIVQNRMRTGLVNFIFNENHDTKILVNPGFQLILATRGKGVSSCVTLRSSRRLVEPQGVAATVPDAHVHVPACPQCPLSVPGCSWDRIPVD